MWERSGRTLKPVEIAKRLGISNVQVRKWKHEDAWEARPRRKRGGQLGNQNAAGNKGGGAPPENKNAWKTGAYASMWLSQVAAEHRLKLMQMETDPRKNLLNEISLLEYREFKMMELINKIEQGWDGKQTEETYVTEKDEQEVLTERKVKKPLMLERLLSIENALSTIQGRKLKCIALLDQFDRNELTTEELRVRIQRMQLEVNKLKTEAW